MSRRKPLIVVMSSGGWLINGSAVPGSLVAVLHRRHEKNSHPHFLLGFYWGNF